MPVVMDTPGCFVSHQPDNYYGYRIFTNRFKLLHFPKVLDISIGDAVDNTPCLKLTVPNDSVRLGKETGTYTDVHGTVIPGILVFEISSIDQYGDQLSSVEMAYNSNMRIGSYDPKIHMTIRLLGYLNEEPPYKIEDSAPYKIEDSDSDVLGDFSEINLIFETDDMI